MRLAAIVVLSIVSLGGCTWVHMAPGASTVNVVRTAPTGCQNQGEVAVAVKHNIAFIERNPLKVRDELETLARNEAAGLQGDTLSPMGDPVAGEQRFSVWRCGR